MLNKKLKKYVFDAGNSNTRRRRRGHRGRGLLPEERSEARQRLPAHGYEYEPLEIEVEKPGGSGGEVGVDWALFCVGPNLRKRDIDEERLGQRLPPCGQERDE